MELYSKELCAELELLVDLDVRFLSGRQDGRPPNGVALAWFFLASGWWLLCHRKTYDVIHFGDLVLYPLAWWHSKISPNTSRVISVFGLDLLYGNRSGLKPSLYRRFVVWAQRNPSVHRFIAISRNTRDIAVSLGFHPVDVVPLGIRNISETHKTNGKDIDPNILFVGRLVRRKGAAWFAKHVLPEIPPDYTLHVAGQVWDASEGEALKNNARIVMHGRVSDTTLAKLRARASVIIMPNVPSENAVDAEGFGLTALEAAASGTPLVASCLEGITDAVAQGKTGFLVPAEDSQAWIAKVSEILTWDTERRIRFCTTADQTLDSDYSWERVARDTISVYQSCDPTTPSQSSQTARP